MLFLGLDLSSQGLKAIVLEDDLSVKSEFSVNFDGDLPEYGTRGGALFGENGSAFSPTIMFVEAVDKLLHGLVAIGVNLAEVGALSASGQQHGSVYWASGSAEKLKQLNPELELVPQLGNGFSVKQSPIWMDASTAKYCAALEAAAGGAANLASETGSKAFRRFTASQIWKIKDKDPATFAATQRISLISAFIVSVFLQKFAPEDSSDASGTNLIDLRSDPPQWSTKMLDIVSPKLREKLCSAPVDSFALLGNIGEYFQRRYGFSGSCRVVAAAGDNPCSAAGMLMREDADLCVSLGTSDTAFMLSSTATPRADVGSIYRNPLKRLSYMPMVVYTNGSLTRESARDYDGKARSWTEFEDLIKSVPKGNNGIVGFYLPRPEIAPETNGDVSRYFNECGNSVEDSEISLGTRCRAALEMRALAIRYHTTCLGMSKPVRIVATGGGSSSPSMIQILADVLQCPVYVSPTVNSAGLGAAYRAFHAVQCEAADGGFVDFSASISSKKDVESDRVLEASPDSHSKATYDNLYTNYIRCEKLVLEDQRA
ncbi:hypothetical protein NDN08_007258 [Rhodosorus marinus]|uniref:Xylulose kinase n=1 Tax=Rhodosorus marinus TaxID=101924 RepID=A0AAV8UJ83_9RHOD|nr:hypothetical protein NDN08_007258 [Rhodosorus marinus]